MTTKYVVAIWGAFVAILTALGAILYKKGSDDATNEFEQQDSNRANQLRKNHANQSDAIDYRD